MTVAQLVLDGQAFGVETRRANRFVPKLGHMTQVVERPGLHEPFSYQPSQCQGLLQQCFGSREVALHDGQLTQCIQRDGQTRALRRFLAPAEELDALVQAQPGQSHIATLAGNPSQPFQ